jgi:hypothetical protein
MIIIVIIIIIPIVPATAICFLLSAIRHLPSPFAIHYPPSSVIVICSLPSSPYHCLRRCRRMCHHDVLNSAIRTAVHMLTLHLVALEASLALL